MTEPASPLITFYKQGWEYHQDALVKTVAALSTEQLGLRPAPDQRSIGELLEHMIGARANWFYIWMGEGDPNLDWDDGQDPNAPSVYEAAALNAMFAKTWRVIASALDRWTPADLEQVFLPPASFQAWRRKQGLEEAPPHTRQWIVWHVLEHEVHHGGELSLTLGIHGLPSFYNW